MPEKTFKCKEKKSRIISRIKRPLIDIEAYSHLKKRWISIPEVLADTGADISILPKYIGEILIEDFTIGKRDEIRGIVPHAEIIIFIHTLRFKVDDKIFELPVAIADSDNIPPILGRIKGLDIFKCIFENGDRIVIHW